MERKESIKRIEFMERFAQAGNITDVLVEVAYQLSEIKEVLKNQLAR